MVNLMLYALVAAAPHPQAPETLAATSESPPCIQMAFVTTFTLNEGASIAQYESAVEKLLDSCHPYEAAIAPTSYNFLRSGAHVTLFESFQSMDGVFAVMNDKKFAARFMTLSALLSMKSVSAYAYHASLFDIKNPETGLSIRDMYDDGINKLHEGIAHPGDLAFLAAQVLTESHKDDDVSDEPLFRM